MRKEYFCKDCGTKIWNRPKNAIFCLECREKKYWHNLVLKREHYNKKQKTRRSMIKEGEQLEKIWKSKV